VIYKGPLIVSLCISPMLNAVKTFSTDILGTDIQTMRRALCGLAKCESLSRQPALISCKSFYCLFQGCFVKVAREVNRALAVHWVPTGRIGGAEELGCQPDLNGCFVNIHAYNACGGFPCGPAGRASFHLNRDEQPVSDVDRELRGTESLSVKSQAVLPGKSTSGERCECALDPELLSRGHNGDTLPYAKSSKVL
jgi:hypothetical protein